MPTIHPVSVYDEKPLCMPTPSTSWSPPNQRIFKEDEMERYQKAFHVSSVEDVDLLFDSYDSVLSARFQSDPLGRSIEGTANTVR